MIRWLTSIVLVTVCLTTLTCAQQTRPAVPHVLIISIDGLRPDCLLRADAPNLRKLMNVGAFSMWARTTDIAITLPSHVSMLTGVTPEKHGIGFNSDPPADARIAVPTLFDLAKEHGFSTGMASGKRKFTLFSNTGHLDHFWTPAETVVDDASTATHAVELISDFRPDVMFVHFGATDATGHGVGWGTPEQIQTISLADAAVGRVLDAYQKAGLLDDTFIIVSADHGGSLLSHGRGDPRSHFIPWIAVGPGVRSDFDLTRLGKDYDLSTFDTFATACYVLKIDPPADIDGHAVTEMFLNADLLQPTAPTTQSAATRTPGAQPAAPEPAPMSPAPATTSSQSTPPG